MAKLEREVLRLALRVPQRQKSLLAVRERGTKKGTSLFLRSFWLKYYEVRSRCKRGKSESLINFGNSRTRHVNEGKLLLDVRKEE